MNYKELKIGKHGLPTWDAMIPFVLHYLDDKNGGVSVRKMVGEISDSLGLPEDLRSITYPRNPNDNMMESRVSWAVSELFNAGAIDRPTRATYVISDAGKDLLKLKDSELTRERIHSLDAYVHHQEEVKKRNELKNINKDSFDDDTSDGLVDSLVEKTDQYNNEIATNLLQLIQSADPSFFEHLVIKLLTKMGYQGTNGSALVTPKTNDGGIDGIINQDPLGTSTVYLQVKRYKDDNVVQRPAIEGFYGALSRVHADRGVFITTSRFSTSAEETAKNFSIILIDGIQLTNLMLEYKVGVQVKQQLEIFEIDDEFFDE